MNPSLISVHPHLDAKNIMPLTHCTLQNPQNPSYIMDKPYMIHKEYCCSLVQNIYLVLE